jgi:neutral ceramidase
MYGMDEANAQVVKEYAQKLPDLLVAAVAAAFKDLEPCRVEWGVGRAGFAANRRQRTPTSVTIGVNPTGPVDHDVPVMRIARASGGATKAIVFGYACHNTTLSHQKICGDYAGYAQAALEGRMPGVTALFFAGCGADSNPSPRGTFELAEKHGTALADAVAAALAAPLTELGGPIRAAYEEISLAFTPPPSRADLEKQLADQNIYIQRRARRLLATLDKTGAISDRYSYPVQTWRFGDGLQLVALAGEVVVDYSLRLKQELGRERTWVMGYANDFCCYIPSLRVLREGGYEGGDSMVYFGIHGPWAPAVEEDIVTAVHRLVAAAK